MDHASASSRTPRVLLIDASPYIFRSYFALPSSIRAPDGRPANASNGFASFLIKLLTEEAPTHVGVAFDGSLTTSFRNDIYSEYKANRELPPPELVRQLQDCRELAAGLGLHTEISDEYEADDLIGSWLDQVTWDLGGPDPDRPGTPVSIVTSDKDLGQLVDGSTDLFDFAKGQRFGPGEIEDKFGVPPEKLVAYLALAGDAVDNIPGVKGIGAKTAAALLRDFESLDALFERRDAVAELPIRGAKSLAKRLGEQEETARLSHRLARIALDAPVSRDPSSFRWHGPNDDWPQLCRRLGFTSLLDRGQALPKSSP